MVVDVFGDCGGGNLCLTFPTERDHSASWVPAAEQGGPEQRGASGRLVLTPPPGEGWTAHLSLSLRWPDGTVADWSEVVPLDGASLEHALSVPRTVRGPSGVALLVGHVQFESTDGARTGQDGLGGRFVELSGGALLASTQRFGARMGVGLIDDPHDRVAIDEESEGGEVVR